MENKEKFSEPWKKFARRWQKYYTPPGRPSKQAIEVYRKFINRALDFPRESASTPSVTEESRSASISNIKILILGSTPELRDLAAEFTPEVAFVDVNLEMILAMNEIVKKKNLQEIMVKANWLNAPLASSYFDIILGDLVVSNLPMDRQDDLLQEIKRLLKPKGYFITKMEVMPEKWQFAEFDDVLDRYVKIPFLGKQGAMELFVYLHNNAWDPKTGTANVQKSKNWMNKYQIKPGVYKHPSNKITRYLNNIWAMWQPMEKQWAFKTEKGATQQVSKYFQILEKVVLNDCYFHEVDESFPIWFCRSRKERNEKQ